MNIIDKNLEKLDELENKFTNIQNEIEKVKSVFDNEEPLELEEITLEELNEFEDFPDCNNIEINEYISEIKDEDFGIKLNIKNKFKAQIIEALLESGYKVSFKGKLILIEEGESKFG